MLVAIGLLIGRKFSGVFVSIPEIGNLASDVLPSMIFPASKKDILSKTIDFSVVEYFW